MTTNRQPSTGLRPDDMYVPRSGYGTAEVLYMLARSPIAGVVGILLFLLAWHLLTLGNGVGDVPGPALTWNGLVDLVQAGILWNNIISSIFRVASGFVLAMAIGIPLGVLCGWYPPVKALLDPIVQSMRPISPIAWIPISILMFGGQTMAEDKSSIFLIFLASFFPIITATTSAVASLELKYIRSASNFGVQGLAFFRRVVLPAALPQILTGLRLALGIAWVIIVAAEMAGAQQGLGYQVLDARNALRIDYVAAAMVVISMIGLGLDFSMSRIEAAALARRGVARR